MSKARNKEGIICLPLEIYVNFQFYPLRLFIDLFFLSFGIFIFKNNLYLLSLTAASWDFLQFSLSQGLAVTRAMDPHSFTSWIWSRSQYEDLDPGEKNEQ